MTYRTSWDYIFDACDPGHESAKNTYIENFLADDRYAENLHELLALVPTELEDLERGQTWQDIASFQAAIQNFYESESDTYSKDLNEQATDLLLKILVQRKAVEAEVDKRHLRYAFSGLSAWEPAQP